MDKGAGELWGCCAAWIWDTVARFMIREQFHDTSWSSAQGTGSAVVLQLAERVELGEGPPRGLGGPHVEHNFTHGGKGE